MMKARRIVAVIAFALFATCSKTIPIDTARAAEVGDPAIGRDLADRWCSSCHGTVSRGADTAPPLAQVMRGRGNDEGRLRSWLAAPHPPMRGIELSRQQTEDVIAWLRQLGRP